MRSDVGGPVVLLAIDDQPQSLELVSAALEHLDGLQILTETDPDQALEVVRKRRPHIVLVDLMMPKMSGMEVLERVIECDPGTEVILMTAHYSTESAVKAIQKGACDYLNKPIDIEKLTDRVAQVIANTRQRRRIRELDHELLEAYRFHGMVGRSPLMLDVFAHITRVAPHFNTILVTGATGTGKELVSHALHKLSPNASGPFVVCNCSAIVETLFESELFGHVRGAFTGAVQDKVGLFELASGGTLFLDEIGEMPLTLQAKLLRVLQNRELQRVGSPAPRKVNVRVVAATNRDLRSLAAAKEFREDLYYRLSMVEIKIPRLAERKEDLALLERDLIERFASQYSKPVRGLTRRAQTLLSQYAWPGNVRELENVLGHACMMTQNEAIDVRDLPEYFWGETPTAAVLEEQGLFSLDEVQRRHTKFVLGRVGGNKVEAAQILGISRATLYRLIDQNAIPPNRSAPDSKLLKSIV
jgi:DNA-binding NtrC family response regulator